MIFKKIHNCNILSKNYSVKKDFYHQYSSGLKSVQNECSFCHKKGCCIRHGFYTRSYITCKDDLAGGEGIRILRVKCTICGHTHAILPEEIVPYFQYCIPFIFLVLYRLFLQRDTVSDICNDMGITAPVLYRWRKRFMKHKDAFLGALHSLKMGAFEALNKLRSLTDYGKGFAARFLEKTEKMPMQTHQNPPNTRRPTMD